MRIIIKRTCFCLVMKSQSSINHFFKTSGISILVSCSGEGSRYATNNTYSPVPFLAEEGTPPSPSLPLSYNPQNFPPSHMHIFTKITHCSNKLTVELSVSSCLVLFLRVLLNSISMKQHKIIIQSLCAMAAC